MSKTAEDILSESRKKQEELAAVLYKTEPVLIEALTTRALSMLAAGIVPVERVTRDELELQFPPART